MQSGQATSSVRFKTQKRSAPHQSSLVTAEQKPQLVALIERVMEKQGIEYYERNVSNQLIEFLHYYITETVQEAKTYRDYAGRTQVTVDDMRLSISSKNYESFTRPLSMSTLKDLAQQKNKNPLPKIDTIASATQDVAPTNRQMKPQAIPCSLPVSTEAIVLTNPNLHVYSEELKQKISDERLMHLRLTRHKLQSTGKQDLFDQAAGVAEKTKKTTPVQNSSGSGKKRDQVKNVQEVSQFTTTKVEEVGVTGQLGKRHKHMDIDFDQKAVAAQLQANIEKRSLATNASFLNQSLATADVTMNQSSLLNQPDDNDDLFENAQDQLPPQMTKYPSFAPPTVPANENKFNQDQTVEQQVAEQPKLLGSMLDSMGLALGDGESDEDLFGNNKDGEKKSENEANW